MGDTGFEPVTSSVSAKVGLRGTLRLSVAGPRAYLRVWYRSAGLVSSYGRAGARRRCRASTTADAISTQPAATKPTATPKALSRIW